MRKIVTTGLLLFLLAATTAWANPSEWRDSNYNFGGIKTILVMEPKFIYEDIYGPDHFAKYPNGEEKAKDQINSHIRKMPNIKFVTINYVIDQIKADPQIPADFDFSSRQVWALIKSEMPKYVDAILYSEVHNYGWRYQYCPPYVTEETQIEKVRYAGVTPDGKQFSGWTEVPRTVVVHHEAKYEIFDSAAINLNLVDLLSGNYIWKYSDSRYRASFAWAKDYDPSGPESMMNRIFDKLDERLPIR